LKFHGSAPRSFHKHSQSDDFFAPVEEIPLLPKLDGFPMERLKSQNMTKAPFYSLNELAFLRLEDLDTSPISKLGELVEKVTTEEAAKADAILQKRLSEDPAYEWETEFREWHFGELFQVRELTMQVLLVSLYHYFETTLQLCLEEFADPARSDSKEGEKCGSKNAKSRKPSGFPSLEKKLKSVTPDYRQFQGFEAVDELRLFSNAWKHEGFVSQQLSSAYPRWEQCSVLEVTEEDFSRLNGGLVIFCRAIGESLHDKWIALNKGFYPPNADTSKKTDDGQKGVSYPSEEG
jgi:hypothetical protein